MERQPITPRADWQEKVENLGFLYHSEGGPYWNESACYVFSEKEVGELERSTNELQRLCLEAVDHVIANDRFNELRIPEVAVPFIKRAWEEDPPAIYGRFDLVYDGQGPPKMLEYNADTPTALLEAAVVQWHWLEEVWPNADQFNSIHERLIAKWGELRDYIPGPFVHFAHVDSMEDAMTTTYLRDTADQAGFATVGIHMSEIGWDSQWQRFVDLQRRPITTSFKLYPWEWLIQEEFSQHLFDTYGKTQWIEPIWKMVLSNKGILAILWEMFPGHPNLLEAHIDSPGNLNEYAKKPLLSREGANVTLKSRALTLSTGGEYGEEGFVYQAVEPLPDFEGAFPVVGSWIIDGESAGIGIREANSLITTNTSTFVPHVME